MAARWTTLWAGRGPEVDSGWIPGEQRPHPSTGVRCAGDDLCNIGDTRRTTATGLTSDDIRSSTIHRPYYRTSFLAKNPTSRKRGDQP